MNSQFFGHRIKERHQKPVQAQETLHISRNAYTISPKRVCDSSPMRSQGTISRKDRERLQSQKIQNEILRLQKMEGSLDQNKKRKLNIGQDDPFANIFLKEQDDTGFEFQEQGRGRIHQKVKKQITKKFALFFQKKKGMSDEAVQEKFMVQGEDSDKSSEKGEIKESDWKNDQYWALPPNVRKAIDIAKMKKKHSDFYYKLRLLNDKIHIFTSIFYNRVPKYQQQWYQNKQKMLEQKLQRQKYQFEDTIKNIDKKLVRRTQSSADVMKFGFGSQRKESMKETLIVSNTASPAKLDKKLELMRKRATSTRNVITLQARKFDKAPQDTASDLAQASSPINDLIRQKRELRKRESFKQYFASETIKTTKKPSRQITKELVDKHGVNNKIDEEDSLSQESQSSKSISSNYSDELHPSIPSSAMGSRINQTSARMVNKINLKNDSTKSVARSIQSAINDINYGVAELIDMRMDIAEKVGNIQEKRGSHDMTTYRILEQEVEESPQIISRKQVTMNEFDITKKLQKQNVKSETDDDLIYFSQPASVNSVTEDSPSSPPTNQECERNKLCVPEKIKILSCEETQEDSHKPESLVTPQSPDIFTKPSDSSILNEKKILTSDDFTRSSGVNKEKPDETEIVKEEHTLEPERPTKEFLIKKKVVVAAQHPNRYFQNNAHMYQCESDLKAKSMKSKNVKQQLHYMKAINMNLSPIKINSSFIMNKNEVRNQSVYNSQSKNRKKVYLDKITPTKINVQDMRLKLSYPNNMAFDKFLCNTSSRKQKASQTPKQILRKYQSSAREESEIDAMGIYTTGVTSTRKELVAFSESQEFQQEFNRKSMMSQQYTNECEEKFPITRRPTTQHKAKRNSGFLNQQIVDQLNFIEKFSKINMQSRVQKVYERDYTQSPCREKIYGKPPIELDIVMQDRPKTKNTDVRRERNMDQSTEDFETAIEESILRRSQLNLTQQQRGQYVLSPYLKSPRPSKHARNITLFDKNYQGGNKKFSFPKVITQKQYV